MVDRLWNGWVLLSRLPSWPEWVGGVVELTAVVGLVEAARRALRRGARPERETVVIWSFLGLFSLIVLASVVGFLSIGGNAHARYLFPLLPVIGILIGIGYAHLPWLLTPAAICWTAIANSCSGTGG